MFAIAFDLDTKELEKHYVPPKSWRKAYEEVQVVLENYGFLRIQGSVYLNEEDDMTRVFLAIQALKSVPWFPLCVTDIRAFKVENWSNFTSYPSDTRLSIHLTAPLSCGDDHRLRRNPDPSTEDTWAPASTVLYGDDPGRCPLRVHGRCAGRSGA